MEWSLTGPPEEAKLYVEGTTTPTFYHIMNGQRLKYDDYVNGLVEWRAKVSDYKPIVLVHCAPLPSVEAELIANIYPFLYLVTTSYVMVISWRHI